MSKADDYGTVDRGTALRGDLSTLDRENHNAKRRYDLRAERYQWFVEALLFRCVTYDAFKTMLGISPKYRAGAAVALVLRPGVRVYGTTEDAGELYTLSGHPASPQRYRGVDLFLDHIKTSRPQTKAWAAHVTRTREALTLALARRALESL